MKIIILISFILCMELFSYSGSCQAQTNSKDFQIHKSKRVFVNKKDRPYIKKQVMEQPVQKKSADDLIASGNQKEELNDYKGAITDFNKALLMEPKSSKILYYCGFIKFQMEDYGNAITDYNRAIESDTESVELYYCRGNAKFQLEYFFQYKRQTI